jgi:hypothetical protein
MPKRPKTGIDAQGAPVKGTEDDAMVWLAKTLREFCAPGTVQRFKEERRNWDILVGFERSVTAMGVIQSGDIIEIRVEKRQSTRKGLRKGFAGYG